MLLPRCPECNTDVTLAQLRASVVNDSLAKFDDIDDKWKALERLYQGLHNKFLDAFPLKMMH